VPYNWYDIANVQIKFITADNLLLLFHFSFADNESLKELFEGLKELFESLKELFESLKELFEGL
jgi:hypothetical protein